MRFRKTLTYSKQSVDSKDIKEVIKVLKSKLITQGDIVKSVEKKISKIVGSKYCIVCNSGTSALHLSCLSLDLKNTDIVWTVANTFAATINAALFCGAKIDFVDIELDTFNICINSLKEKLKKSKPTVIIVVHLGGISPNLDEIKKLAKKYKFRIIEDASHSFGGKFKKKHIGSCHYSDLTTFSFHALKTITSAEGGAITTNSNKIYNKLKLYRENGIIKKKSKRFNDYDQVSLGLNNRMSEVNASLLNSQLKKYQKFINIRTKIQERYKNFLQNYNVLIQKQKKHSVSSHHLLIVVLKDKKISRNKLINVLYKKHNIYTTLHYPLLYKQNFLKDKFKYLNLKNSEYYSKNALSLPIHPEITKNDIQKIFKILNIYLIRKND